MEDDRKRTSRGCAGVMVSDAARGSESVTGQRYVSDAVTDAANVKGQRYFGATLRQISPARPDP